ncbi:MULTISPECIES: hypothetical protein [Bradyrhizobium]|uniref:Uncharacterized protein n=1 Tax=Bradyrhizobium yuanmingense TaxID=108015 RepID=A0A1C3UX23_9BRAD|nr:MULTISPECIES: hypothetical protein [Bradyrhizobium]MCA1377322.1 hypothetical protein [Bradyrhizobium sp. IC4060]MCA1392623.1 hypothetical protein [Bradyrhizobium sp. IC3123]MCA1412164.1 hypothetical protein [Bradyrhizobium sp. NBAIM20]MCA1464764.1 hypothetical protein [Bradyrhizobium sp. NBAIM18]MCA1478746.1 hypothetical protein [Bradyrhizobium sp. NBAIM08]
MPYFTANQTQSDRTSKVLADVFCALLLGTFSIVFFGLVGGLIALVLLEACLLALDWVMPSDDDAAGVVR